MIIALHVAAYGVLLAGCAYPTENLIILKLTLQSGVIGLPSLLLMQFCVDDQCSMEQP